MLLRYSVSHEYGSSSFSYLLLRTISLISSTDCSPFTLVKHVFKGLDKTPETTALEANADRTSADTYVSICNGDAV